MTQKHLIRVLLAALALALAACNKGGSDNPPSSNTSPTTVTRTPPRRSTTPVDTNEDTIVGDRVVHVPAGSTPARPSEQAPLDPPLVDTAGHVVGGAPPPLGQRECEEPYREARPEWSPGLPSPPSNTPTFTDVPGPTSAIRYTDARQDDLFHIAIDRANGFPDSLNRLSRGLAKQIRDVHVSADPRQGGLVKVQIVYLHKMQKAAVVLHGQIAGLASEIKLQQEPTVGQGPGDPFFTGLMTCADLERGCKNIVMRLDLRTPRGNKVLRSVYLVHRWSEAHVTMSGDDRRKFPSIPNQAHSLFAQYLSNIADNACLKTLADVAAKRRELPACEIKSLQSECGSEQPNPSVGRASGLSSWAVVYGKAAFEWSMTGKNFNGVADFEVKRPAYLSVRGPLAYSNVRPPSPMFSQPLIASGTARDIGNIYLMTNDGGGNLNLRFDFLGLQEDQMRVSVSSILPSALYADSLAAKVRQMPALSRDEIASDQQLEEPLDIK